MCIVMEEAQRCNVSMKRRDRCRFFRGQEGTQLSDHEECEEMRDAHRGRVLSRTRDSEKNLKGVTR